MPTKTKRSKVEVEPTPTVAAQQPREVEFKKSGDTDIEDFLKDLRADVDKAVADRNANSRKNLWSYQMRRCQLGKQDKNFPFPKSSDLRYPIAEMKIREKKPGDVAVVLNAPKIVRYSPGMGGTEESKNRLELFANYLYRSHIPRFDETLDATADKKYETGKSFVKVTWSDRREWRTKVFLREDGDKLKAFVMASKLQMIQAAMQAKQQSRVQAPVQSSQPGQAPSPPQMQQSQQPQGQQQGQPRQGSPYAAAASAQQSQQQAPQQQINPQDIQASREELIAAFADLNKVDLKDKAAKKRVESTISQYLEGKDYITYMEQVSVYRGPLVQMIPENSSVIYPYNTPYIADAEWVAHESYYSDRELLENSEENGGKFKNVDALREHFEKKPTAPITDDRMDMEAARAAAEGVKQVVDYAGYYRIWEVSCWIARKHISRFVGIGGDDDTPVRSVVTFCPDAPADDCPPLDMTEFPYDHYEWPFHEFVFNYRIDRAYDPQGAVELIYAFNEEYNRSSNAAMDRSTICNSPPTLIWEQSDITPQQFRQVSQALVTRCPPHQAVYMPEYPNLAARMEFDAEKCMSWIDKILGAPNMSQLQGRDNSPTKAEVMAIQAPAGSIDYLEHIIWLSRWTGAFRQVHALCKQYWFLQDDKFQFANTENPNEVVTIKKEDFDAKWIIQSGGDPTKGDAQFEFQKWFIFSQLAMGNPAFMPAIKPYELLSALGSRSIGFAEAAGVMNNRQVADQMQQAMVKAAAEIMARQAQGKRPQRQSKVKQVPSQGAGIVPQ